MVCGFMHQPMPSVVEKARKFMVSPNLDGTSLELFNPDSSEPFSFSTTQLEKLYIV